MRLSLSLLASLVLLFAACDSGEPEPARILGTYSGTGDPEDVDLRHTFVIQENENGFIDGQVTIRIVETGETFEFDVRGNRTGASFDLDIGSVSDGLDYRGTVDDEARTMQGVMEWPPFSGVSDYALTVTRTTAKAAPSGRRGSVEDLARAIR